MTDDSSGDGSFTHDGKHQRSAGAELIIPIAGSGFTLYYFWTIWDSPWTAQVSAFFIGSILLLCSAVVVARILRAHLRGKANFGFDILIEPHGFILKRIALFALTLGFIAVIQFAGYTLTTFLFLMLAIALLNDGQRLRQTAILAACLALGGWALFVLAFEIRFPAGPFEILMEGIL